MKFEPSSCIRPARMGMESLGPVEERERPELGRKVPSATGNLDRVSVQLNVIHIFNNVLNLPDKCLLAIERQRVDLPQAVDHVARIGTS
jgi:hypothetical protein